MTSLVLFILASACSPLGFDREQARSSEVKSRSGICPSGFVLDGSTCVPESCETGRWGGLPVDVDTIYVDIAATTGDGTEAEPFPTIQQGLDRAGALGGALVAVAAGTYRETLSFTTNHADVHLAGRCREMVTLDASGGNGVTPGIAIDTRSGAVKVSGVTVRKSSHAGLWVSSGLVVTRDSAIMESAWFGVAASTVGFGGLLDLTMEGCVIEGNAEAGIFVHNAGTRVTLHDSTVLNTQPNAAGQYGRGVEVSDTAVLVAEACLIEGNAEYGLYAANPGTRVSLSDVTVRDTVPNTGGGWGRGIEVSDRANLGAVDCHIDGNADMGLFVTNPYTNVTLRDSIVRGTEPGLEERGWGIEIGDGATLTAEGSLIEANTQCGAFVHDPGSHLSLWNTTIRDTRTDVNGRLGRGIDVEDGASLSAEACLVDGNTDIGIFADTPGTRVTLLDTTVRETLADGNGEYGQGIEIVGGAILAAEDCFVEGNTDVGLIAAGTGTRVTVRDSTISDTRQGISLTASASSGLTVQDEASLSADRLVSKSNQGPGILVNTDGVLECVGCTMSDNQFAGALALNGGSLSITDSLIEGTSPSVNLLGGAGVYAWPWAQDSPSVTLTNSIIRDNPIAGVWLMGNGTYVLIGNTISGGGGEPFASGFRCGDGILARDGVLAWNGFTGLLIQDNLLLDASGAGVFLDDSAALMSGDTYDGNAMDLVVQNQSCDALPGGYSEAPECELCPTYSHPTCYAEFFFKALPAEPVKEGALRPRLPTSSWPGTPLHPVAIGEMRSPRRAGPDP